MGLAILQKLKSQDGTAWLRGSVAATIKLTSAICTT